MSDWIVVDPANPPKLDPSTRVELYWSHERYSTKGPIAQFNAWQDITKYRILDTNPIQDLVTRAEEKYSPELPPEDFDAPPSPANPLAVQVAGDHYKKLKIQPIEFIHANGIQFAEGSVIKYVTRWRDKGGIKDLEKARHFLDLLIDLERKATE